VTGIVSGKYRGSVAYFLMYSELIDAARHRGAVTYREIAAIMGLPLKGSHMRAEVGHISIAAAMCTSVAGTASITRSRASSGRKMGRDQAHPSRIRMRLQCPPRRDSGR
jgi:hypothetical protein